MKARSPIQGAYDQWSATYDTQINPTRDLDALALKSLLPDTAGKTIIEIGCGTGKNTLWLAPRCARLVALDFSTGMLRVASEKVRQPHVHFVQADIRSPFPLIKGLGDVVMINLVLEHIEKLAPVLEHAAAQMAPGAVLIISEYHPDRLITGRGARIERDGEEPIWVGSYRHPLAEFESAIESAGLKIEDRREWFEHQLPEPPPSGDTRPLLITYKSFQKAKG